MTDADTILEFLGSVHPYDNLPQDERARVARSFSRREWQAGETVFQHGEPLAGLFLIESAGVEVTDRNGGLVSMLSRGNSFGERGLMRGGLAATTVRVSQPGAILMLPLAEFKRLMAEEPAFSRFFNRWRGIESSATEMATLKVSDCLVREP
ncbi:MAG: cyclic nucleotide-binding domain-containing protein, partial [Paracoccus sp. (in: a-proteobacteria)]|nr:cyclic nucleotide-binding domain-containing protein [Paracoccus sp. (in: a-proteobacteria)]